MNYTKIKITLKDWTDLYIDEDELIVFKLSGEYDYIMYLNDKDNYHRLDGPAVEGANGSKWWYVDGKLHRLDGPAVEWTSGGKWWWVNGKEYSQEEFEKEIK